MGKKRGQDLLYLNADGCMLTVLPISGRALYAIKDIDVAPGVKKITLGTAGLMFPEGVSRNTKYCDAAFLEDSEKVFPDVEALIIGERVVEIKIPNKMFPNVRKIRSRSGFYMDGVPYIAKQIFDPRAQKDNAILMNVFCRRDGEAIDISNATEIAPGAFAGCGRINVTGTKSVLECAGDAFSEAMLDAGRRDDGCILIGTILAGVKNCKDSICIPEGTTCIAEGALSGCTARRVDIAGAVPSDVAFGQAMDCMPKSAKELALGHPGINKFLIPWQLKMATKYVEKLEVAEDDGYCKSMDGIVYSKNGATLLLCPTGRKGRVEVANGTKAVADHAFNGVKGITEIVFPEGLQRIGFMATLECQLKEVALPSTLEFVDGYNFGSVETFRIKGDTPPKGLLLGAAKTHDAHESEGGLKPYATIGFRGCTFVLPFDTMEPRCAKFMEDWDGGEFNEERAMGLYSASNNLYIRHASALQMARLHPESKKLIDKAKRDAPGMAEAFIKAGETEELVALLGMDILSRNKLINLVSITQKLGAGRLCRVHSGRGGKEAKEEKTIKLMTDSILAMAFLPWLFFWGRPCDHFHKKAQKCILKTAQTRTTGRGE